MQRAQRRAAAEAVRHRASQPAKLPAQLQIRNARTRKTSNQSLLTENKTNDSRMGFIGLFVLSSLNIFSERKDSFSTNDS